MDATERGAAGLRVLILESNSADAELMAGVLAQIVPSPKCVRVQTEKDFLRELETTPPDLILVDQEQSGFDSERASALAREKHPVAPCLLIPRNVGARREIEKLDPSAQLEQQIPTLNMALRCALCEASEALRRNERLYRVLASNIPNCSSAVFDNELRFVLVEGGDVLKTMGVSKETLAGRKLTEALDPTTSAKVEPLLHSALAGATASKQVSICDRWYQLHTAPLPRDTSSLGAGILIVLDITEAKRAEEQIRALNEDLERRVEQRTSELEAANKEMKTFSYSVSHDLRAPLRHIEGFVEILQRHASEHLDVEGKRHLQTIAVAARRMSKLIDDLLAFSMLRSAELQKRSVELKPLLLAVLRDLHHEPEGREVEWVIRDLPAVRADPSLLRQVLLNLVTNALKYTRPRAQPRIEVGATQTDDEITVFIRDNGVGFDMNSVGRLFGVFQRLHRATEFEGTGIGLAIVRQIIQRHGGRTWAEGKVGEGAVFYFSLPVAEK